MKIIVVGGGKVGTALCRSLVDEKHDVILIEQDENVLKQITKRYDIIGIKGNGANFKILEQADVEDCDIFITMTEHDEVNMVSAVLAKKMGAKETIVRVRNPEYSNSYFKEKNILGFSMVVNPELLAARHIANNIDFPNAISVEHFASGRVVLMEFNIKPNSQLCNMSLAQFRKRFGNVLICAIERDHQLIIPNGDMSILPSDNIFVTGNRIDMVLFHSYIKTGTVKNLLLVGAGKIAYYLLNILKHTKIDVKVIEQNRKRVEWFSQEFPQVHVILGDGTDKEVLLEERAQNFDAVATLTGVDEENIITSLFLDSQGVKKIITKVNRTSLLDILDKKEFSSIVTPKSIATDTIMHFIRGRVNAQQSNLEALHHVANGRIETLQFHITEDCSITGKSLATLHFKPGVLIAAIIRNGRTVFPSGTDTIQIGDRVIVVTLMQNITQVTDLVER